MSVTRISLAAAPALLTLTLGCNAFAQSTSEKELSVVSIGASRSDSRLEDMAQHVTLITQEEIQKSPAQTLDQLLRTVPGLNFTGVPAAISDPTGHQTKMRGMGNAKVLVLLDGVPVHDPFYLTTQWYKVPLSNIERVEIVRGGNSSLWGNMAAAGVVNIVSRRPADNSGEVSVSAGTQGSHNVAASKNFVLSDALSVNLAVDQYHTDGYQTILPEYKWRYPGKGTPSGENTNIRLTTYFRPSSSVDGYLRLGYHIQDQDLGYQFNNNKQKTPDAALGVTTRIDKSSSVAVNAWAQYVNFEKYNGNACYWQGASCPSNSSVTPSQVNSNVVQFYSQYGSQRYREQGASSVYSKSFGGWFNSVQAGVDYRHLSATDDERFYGQPTSPVNPQNFNSSSHGEGQQTFEGLFAQAKFFPVDPLDVTVSGRYDVWSNTNRINTRTTAAGVTTGGAMADTTKSAFSPGVAVRYDLTEQVDLRGSAYKAFRAPGFNNTTRTYGTSSSTTIANPFLKPETLTGWELGGDYKTDRLSLGATYFHYSIKDMIATYTVNANASAPDLVKQFCSYAGGATFPGCDGASSVKFYTNDQDGESHGVELTANWKVHDALRVNASYTHTSTFLTRRGTTVTDPLNVQLAGVPWDVALVGVTWKPLEKLKTYAEVQYIGSMYVDTTSQNSTMRAIQGGNTIFNLSASYAVDKQMDIFAGVVNLFDHQYSENTYTYNQPYTRTLSMPRAINAGLKYRF